MAKEDWPPNGLEWLNKCPVCHSVRRTLLYQSLVDLVFFCAPGEWTFYRCEECGSAYLDPRPTPDTINIAYSNYFTHNLDNRESLQNLGFLRRIRRTLANGYLNHRFGTNYNNSNYLGVLIAMMLPAERATLDGIGRNLPKGTKGKLLDVGCGNGSFLEFAKNAGWDVVGVDPDPKAVSIACSRGLDVREGDISVLYPLKEQFDGITISHVIEHLHNPIETITFCYQLLKPGGWIWIETPNFEAQGHMRYKANWRGLEPPRHLVLFTRKSLQDALEKVGFIGIEDQPYRPLCHGMFASSEAIRNGQDPNEVRRLSLAKRFEIYRAENIAKKNINIREFITVRAWKAISN